MSHGTFIKWNAILFSKQTRFVYAGMGHVFDTLLSEKSKLHPGMQRVIPFLRVGGTLSPHLLHLCVSIGHSLEGPTPPGVKKCRKLEGRPDLWLSIPPYCLSRFSNVYRHHEFT